MTEKRSEGPFAWVGGAIRGISATAKAALPAFRAAAQTVRSIRQLGVASEVGVAAESVLPQNAVGRNIVRGCWGLSIAYVLADLGIRTSEAPKEMQPKVFADLAIWHTSASLIVPAVLIGKLVHLTQDAVAKLPRLPGPARRWLPVAVAVASIVPIVPAVDHATDFIMDRTIRPALGTAPYVMHEQHEEKKE